MDANWSSDHDDRRTTGCFFKLVFGGGAVSWRTKKQQTVGVSSCEAVFEGLAAADQEAMFVIVTGEGSQCCINLSTNRVMHKRSKHADKKF